MAAQLSSGRKKLSGSLLSVAQPESVRSWLMSIRRASETSLYRHNNHLNANLRHIRRISSAVFSGLGFHACELVGTHSLRVSFPAPGLSGGRGLRIVLSNFSVVIVGPRGPRQHGRRRLRGAIVDGLHQALVVNRQRRACAPQGYPAAAAVLKASRAMFIPAQRQAQARVVTQDRQLAGGRRPARRILRSAVSTGGRCRRSQGRPPRGINGLPRQ